MHAGAPWMDEKVTAHGVQRESKEMKKKETPFCEVLMEEVVAVATSGGNGGELLATDDAFGASGVLL